MGSHWRGLYGRRAELLLSLSAAFLASCASPGAPKQPSLRLPQVVRDLSATRSGDVVELRFTMPSRTTDDQPIRSPTLVGSLCRQLGVDGPCMPVDAAETSRPLAIVTPSGHGPNVVVWHDPLPPTLLTGTARVLAYRVELRSAAGRSVGPSQPAYTAAGGAPPPVEGLSGRGTRLGVLLEWTPAPNTGEVLIERTRTGVGPAALSGAKTGPATVWLQAHAGDRSAGRTLDGSVEEGVPYQYSAVRRVLAQIGGRSLELRSGSSSGVEVTWRDVFPPPVPTGLTALGFLAGPETRGSGYAVDLIWQPVSDPRLTGYVVYRQRFGAAGEPEGGRERLTTKPVVSPSFHDETALASSKYVYEVTAMDAKGNESAPAKTEVMPAKP